MPTVRLLPRRSEGPLGKFLKECPRVNFLGFTLNVEDADSEHREFDSMETDEFGLPAFQRRQEARKARSKPIPAAGAKEVDQVAMFESTGGLRGNFYNTRPEPQMSE
ncbi:hypothetical protein THAR02_09301 [Trichoderma harzianum]|uniref:Uncharacterized protein n=1 Tax=Trichoderma harzianum TaxID=5544 RepID=A0A0F9XD71_TRIHA|nr:hypothetical protein THAR02_09301 [Trichoderma harzianum]